MELKNRSFQYGKVALAVRTQYHQLQFVLKVVAICTDICMSLSQEEYCCMIIALGLSVTNKLMESVEFAIITEQLSADLLYKGLQITQCSRIQPAAIFMIISIVL